MNTNSVVLGVSIGFIVILVILRQVFPKRVTMMTLIGLPLLAAYEGVHTLPRPSIPAGGALECSVTIALSIIAGFIQTRDTKITTRDGEVYCQGGLLYISSWFGLLLARFAIEMIFQGAEGMSHLGQNEWMMCFDVTAAWTVRSIGLYLRYPAIVEHLQQQRINRRRNRRA